MLNPYQKKNLKINQAVWPNWRTTGDQIIDKGHIEEIYQRLYGSAPKRVGGVFMVHCPFHQENTPSCALYPNTQNYYCFSCNAHGDSIDLVMKFANVDFKEAIEIIKGKSIHYYPF